MQKLHHQIWSQQQGPKFCVNSPYESAKKREQGHVSHANRRQLFSDEPHSLFPKQTAPEKKQAKPSFSAIKVECELQVHAHMQNWGKPFL